MNKTFTKISFSLLLGGMAFAANAVEPVYLNTFEAGVGDCEIIGNGEIKNVGGQFGNVFANALDGMRTNFLRLPGNSFDKVDKNLSVAVWLNKGNETDPFHYMWSPIFACYATYNKVDNGCPMLVCEYRGGFLQINTNGPDNVGDNWCDFVDAQNVEGHNTFFHGDTDWLADGEWHLYTVTFTPTSAVVYFDGEVAQKWEIAGEGAGNTCDISAVPTEYICLGGNQAWGWGDPDPGFYFDDIAIYNVALSQEEVKAIMTAKANSDAGVNAIENSQNETPVYYNLNGVKVSNPEKGQILIKKTSGKTSKVIF